MPEVSDASQALLVLSDATPPSGRRPVVARVTAAHFLCHCGQLPARTGRSRVVWIGRPAGEVRLSTQRNAVADYGMDRAPEHLLDTQFERAAAVCGIVDRVTGTCGRGEFRRSEAV